MGHRFGLFYLCRLIQGMDGSVPLCHLSRPVQEVDGSVPFRCLSRPIKEVDGKTAHRVTLRGQDVGSTVPFRRLTAAGDGHRAATPRR